MAIIHITIIDIILLIPLFFLVNSTRSVLMFVGRMLWIFVPRRLVVAGRHTLRSHVEVPTVWHPFWYNTEGSSVDGDEFDAVHSNTTEMFRTTERVIPKSKEYWKIVITINFEECVAKHIIFYYIIEGSRLVPIPRVDTNTITNSMSLILYCFKSLDQGEDSAPPPFRYVIQYH